MLHVIENVLAELCVYGFLGMLGCVILVVGLPFLVLFLPFYLVGKIVCLLKLDRLVFPESGFRD